MRTVRFTQLARQELIEAQDWYEAEAPGLGRRFRAEVDRAVQRIAGNPFQFPTILKDLRRARVNVFPYSLFFAAEVDEILIIACFHSSRDPQHWQERV